MWIGIAWEITTKEGGKQLKHERKGGNLAHAPLWRQRKTTEQNQRGFSVSDYTLLGHSAVEAREEARVASGLTLSGVVGHTDVEPSGSDVKYMNDHDYLLLRN